ncbi:MAG: prephenate dehydratase [Pseudomonadota bacterium]|nr:prephenate dehydratase [Pseudomonadota bacterium]
MTDEFKRHRDRIDSIDDEILILINERARHAQAIGHLKNGQGIYRPDREAQIIRNIREKNEGPLSDEAVGTLFREIMSACLALEKPLDIAFLGPLGTWSHAATTKHFGQFARLCPASSIDEVFHSVESGSADYGLVPVENSTEGAIGRTLDLLLETPLKICGEVVLPIHHCLLSRESDLASVRIVYSHIQSLGQCHAWLGSHLPGAERLSVVSNAEAAKKATQEEGAAAIASRVAADLYGLTILAENIEDELQNTTRFLVLGQHAAARTGHDRTSLVLAAANRPGAMHDMLAPFADHSVSLTKLESRPSRVALWEYVFYLDLEGHIEDEPVRLAIDEVGRKASFVKILGSYPVAPL